MKARRLPMAPPLPVHPAETSASPATGQLVAGLYTRAAPPAIAPVHSRHASRPAAGPKSAQPDQHQAGDDCHGGDDAHRPQWLAKHDDGVALLIFRRGLDLIACQLKRDHIAFRIIGRKMQGLPIDRNFPAADPKKAAEINDGGARLSVAINNDIDEASHIFAGGAANIFSENWLGVLCIDDDGRRFVLADTRWIFRCRTCRGR